MKKFEYKSVGVRFLSKGQFQELDVDKLNELGKDGWELVSVVTGNCIFKRKMIA